MATALPKVTVEPLEVVTETPGSKVVLAPSALVEKINVLGQEAGAIVIDSGNAAEIAAKLLTEVATIAKQLETTRQQVKAPFLAICNAIDAAAKKPAGTLTLAGNAVRVKLSKWQEECDRRAREEEAKRQQELQRLERERLAIEKAQREAEAARQAAAAKPATVANDEFADFDAIAAEDSATRAHAEKEKLAAASARLQETAAVVAPKPAGVSFTKVLKCEVVDVRRLPEHLVIVTANEAAIRVAYCIGWKEGAAVPVVPGLRFSVETATRVAGRR